MNRRPYDQRLIGLWAFDLVSNRVWWEAATNIDPTTSENELFADRKGRFSYHICAQEMS